MEHDAALRGGGGGVRGQVDRARLFSVLELGCEHAAQIIQERREEHGEDYRGVE